MKEKWKDIKGYEGLYKISNLGRIKSFKKQRKGYILSNKNKKGGYLSIVLKDTKNISKSYKIHRLVAMAFIPNPQNLPQVNHIDCNKQNNKVSNLEWVSAKDNMAHAISNNPNVLKGMVNYNKFIRPKKILQCTLEGLPIAEYINSIEASEKTGVCYRNILQVASREEYKPGKIRKQAGGYVWKYKEEVI